MAFWGVPIPMDEHADRALLAALDCWRADCLQAGQSHLAGLRREFGDRPLYTLYKLSLYTLYKLYAEHFANRLALADPGVVPVLLSRAAPGASEWRMCWVAKAHLEPAS